MPRDYDDLTGQQFGLLTVIRLLSRRHKNLYWLCECQCGEMCNVRAEKLRSGRTVSCGCWRNVGGSVFTAKARGTINYNRSTRQ